MEIPILSGVYTDESSDIRTSYPRNLVPVAKASGISQMYLRPSSGVRQIGAGPGIDRGAINWNGVCYRVMGTKLVSVSSDAVVTILGDVGGIGQVRMTYSFDRLAIASSTKLYYWDGVNLIQVIDIDLGPVIDFTWIDGYFLSTDGEFLVVTDLADPTQVNPFKYGSSEADPDPVKAVLKIAGEVHVLNRYTIEAFSNVGGTGFPFQRIDGAQIQKGVIGTFACIQYMGTIAFLGGGNNESPAVWSGINGSVVKISTREIDTILLDYTENQLSTVIFEQHTEKELSHLYIRLPDQTLVYDGAVSKQIGQPVWFTLTSSLVGLGRHRIANRLWCYNKWIVCDTNSTAIGEESEEISTHWGEKIGWVFSTNILYNEGKGVQIHQLELVALTGRAALGVDPIIWTQYSNDGEAWSIERPIKAGKIGERMKRLIWLQQGFFRNWRIQKFRGTSDTPLSIIRLEAQIEGMTW